MASARRARRLADAGRLSEIQVDQAVQSELSARDRWIREMETYKSALDLFKNLLGLPPDANVELDRSELNKITAPAEKLAINETNIKNGDPNEKVPPADAPVKLIPPGRENAGPLELNDRLAVELGLENRYDLQIAKGAVYDAQRNVVVSADALRADLTLFGSANVGGRRSVATAGLDDAELRPEKGVYSGAVTLDLPLERTKERNDYRNSYILLERAVRSMQDLEDSIKLDVRNRLRDLLQSRESLKIQTQAVVLAQKRVDSTSLFLEAGLAEIRDLLDARNDLLSAQNQLTSAAVSYRVAELFLQSDMGVLKIDENGLWQEYVPKKGNSAEH